MNMFRTDYAGTLDREFFWSKSNGMPSWVSEKRTKKHLRRYAQNIFALDDNLFVSSTSEETLDFAETENPSASKGTLLKLFKESDGRRGSISAFITTVKLHVVILSVGNDNIQDPRSEVAMQTAAFSRSGLETVFTEYGPENIDDMHYRNLGTVALINHQISDSNKAHEALQAA